MTLLNLLTSHLFQPDIEQIFSDRATIKRWLTVEKMLAQVQADQQIIDEASASAIAASCESFVPHVFDLRGAMENSGVPIAELVKQLRQHVVVPHGDAVHFGATTQDIIDTALVMQLRDAIEVIRPILNQLIERLAAVAHTHRTTVMPGRTHSQQAVPTTFGLKAANWLAPLLHQRERLAQLTPHLLVIQFGGAAGTLAALGHDGLAVQRALAAALGFRYANNNLAYAA